MESNFGLAVLKGEGAPMHPDEVMGDMTQEQYDRQLAAYNQWLNTL